MGYAQAMRRAVLFAALVLLVAACAGDPVTLVGQRADGLTVVCEPDEDAYNCDPQPSTGDGSAGDGSATGEPGHEGDAPGSASTDGCATWSEGGAARVLWPPNHKMHLVSVADCARLRPSCDVAARAAVDGVIVAVTSDEPLDVGAGGDGYTPEGDLVILDARTVLLRAERQGGGNGRVYRLEIEDGSGARDACEVHVPHDRGPYGGAIEDGVAVRISSGSR